MDDVSTRPLVPNDKTAVLALLQRTFGPSDRHAEAFARWSVDQDRHHALLAWKESACIAIGVVSVHRESLDARYAAFRPWRGALALPQAPDARFGSYGVLAVDPTWRGRGVGSHVAKVQMAWLASKGCAFVTGVSWIHPGGERSQGLFQRAGFELAGESDSFYPDLHRASPSGCPYCGENCTCGGELYALPLPDAGIG